MKANKLVRELNLIDAVKMKQTNRIIKQGVGVKYDIQKPLNEVLI